MLCSLALSMCILADEWTTLPLPSACSPAPEVLVPAAILDGHHVRLSAKEPIVERKDGTPRLPVALVMQMLEEDARAHGSRLEFFRGAPALLVRGEAAAVARARELLLDLEQSLDRLAVDLEVSIRPDANGCAGAGDAGSARSSPAASTAKFTGRVRSGETGFFGTRASQGFLASFDVEVAADSGVADPVQGMVLTGQTIHVRAARLDGGRRIHLSGLVDLAELAAMEAFDPGTPDLGVLQQPRVVSAQAAFAGVVDNEGALEIVFAGTPLSRADWSVCIRASTRVEPEPRTADPSGWMAIDLAFLSSSAPEAPSFPPGAQLADHDRTTDTFGAAFTLPASAVAAAVENTRAGAAGGRAAPRAPLYWTDDILFVPRADLDARREALALVRGAESLRTDTGRLEMRQGISRALVPVCAGFATRVLIGTERAWLVDYRTEIAPQTWMAAPDVQTTFDGLALESRLQQGMLAAGFWTSASAPAVELSRADAHVGKLQVLARNLRASSARLAHNAAEQQFLLPESGSGAGALTLRYTHP